MSLRRKKACNTDCSMMCCHSGGQVRPVIAHMRMSSRSLATDLCHPLRAQPLLAEMAGRSRPMLPPGSSDGAATPNIRAKFGCQASNIGSGPGEIGITRPSSVLGRCSKIVQLLAMPPHRRTVNGTPCSDAQDASCGCCLPDYAAHVWPHVVGWMCLGQVQRVMLSRYTDIA